MFKNWLYTFFTAGFLAITGFVTSVVVARGLGAEGRGELASVMLIVTLSASLSQLGLSQAVVYMARAFSNLNIKKTFLISLSLVTLCGGVTSFVAIVHFQQINMALLLPAVVLAAALSAGGFTTAITQLDSSLAVYNGLRLAVPLALMTSVLGLILLKILSVELMLWGHVVAAGLAICISMQWASKKFTKISYKRTPYFKYFRKYLSLGMKYYANNVVGLALNNLDKVYFFWAGGIREFGIYSVAFGTSRLIGNVQEAISTVIFSRFAGSQSKDLTANTLRAFRMTFIPMLLMAALLSTIALPLFKYIFGNEYVSAALPFSLLLFECVIASSGWILAQQFNADGRPGLILLRQMIAIFPLLVMLPFIPKGNLAPWLAGLLLIGALIRLMVTICLYSRILKTGCPSLIPTRTDINASKNFVRQLRRKGWKYHG